MAAVGHAAELFDDNVHAFQIGYGRRMQLLQELEAGGWHDNANTDEIINNTVSRPPDVVQHAANIEIAELEPEPELKSSPHLAHSRLRRPTVTDRSRTQWIHRPM